MLWRGRREKESLYAEVSNDVTDADKFLIPPAPQRGADIVTKHRLNQIMGVWEVGNMRMR